ncbi:leucine efflux protein LeuE [Oryzomicrobium sp.]|uniref:leucine efflux protein LeuE n=1 Tax=Oryzomicrobium sp. TaxID=1911578 RepID=UPI002FE33106
MHYGITDLATFVLGTIFIVLVPGPNSMYVMTVASRQGIAAGYRGACGIFLGDLILMVLAATGVASLFKANPALFVVLKYAGAAYLVYLGLNLVRAGIRRWRGAAQAAPETPATPPPEAARPFQVALLISLLNPKAILFYVSFFIQFVSPGYAHPALSFLILGTIVQICSAVYLSALIFGGSYLAETFRRRRRLAAGATGGIGGLFIGFGLKLADAGVG